MLVNNGPKASALRILVMEDELFIADEIAMLLDELSYEVVGPVPTVEKALGIVGGESLDGAVLDVNLQGVSSEPVAVELVARGIPFVVVTGYGDLDLPTDLLNSAPRVSKPYDVAELERVLRSVFVR